MQLPGLSLCDFHRKFVEVLYRARQISGLMTPKVTVRLDIWFPDLPF